MQARSSSISLQQDVYIDLVGLTVGRCHRCRGHLVLFCRVVKSLNVGSAIVLNIECLTSLHIQSDKTGSN